MLVYCRTVVLVYFTVLLSYCYEWSSFAGDCTTLCCNVRWCAVRYCLMLCCVVRHRAAQHIPYQVLILSPVMHCTVLSQRTSLQRPAVYNCVYVRLCIVRCSAVRVPRFRTQYGTAR